MDDTMKESDIFIITIDSLRKDYSREVINSLRDYGFINYERCISPSSWTIPSHASMFTGLYPLYHKIHETKSLKVPDIRFKDEDEMIHSILSSYGYDTYLLTANLFLSDYFGINNFDYHYDTLTPLIRGEERNKINEVVDEHEPETGFDYFKSFLKEKEIKLPLKIILRYLNRFGNNWPRDKGAKETVKIIDKKFSNQGPNYVFINLMEPHEPYSLSEGFTNAPVINRLLGNADDEVIKNWKEEYPKQSKYVKNKTIEIIKTLKEKNKFENSLIIVTSDHGQLLGEKDDRLGHGLFLDDELLKVPLLIKFPRNQEIKITKPENKKYVSLSKIKPLVKKIAQNKLESDELLYSDFTIAETYGTHYKVQNPGKEEKEKIQELQKYKIAIYYKNSKTIFNVDDWEFEEIQNQKESNEEIKQEIKKKILKYLETASSMNKIKDLK